MFVILRQDLFLELINIITPGSWQNIKVDVGCLGNIIAIERLISASNDLYPKSACGWFYWYVYLAYSSMIDDSGVGNQIAGIGS